jgi:hypothetical protein
MLYNVGYLALILAGLGVLILGALRAVQMSKGLVDATYRNRARWGAVAAFVIAIDIAATFVANITGFTPTSLEAAELGFATFASAFIALFAFADSTVLVAIKSDFFHRSTVRWTQARRPALVAILVCAVIDAALGGYTPFFAVFVVVAVTGVAYAAAALFVGARRTQDKTLKRHVRLLGWALVVLLPSVILSTFTSYAVANLVSQAGIDAGFYLFYRALMSLTPLGRVERADASSAPVPQVGVLASKVLAAWCVVFSAKEEELSNHPSCLRAIM